MVGEPLCDVGTPLLTSNKSTQGHIMKIEWLVADVTAVCPPDRTECAMLGVILTGALFWQIQAVFVVRAVFCDARTPS